MSSDEDFVCLDSESCGFTGPVTLFQWGIGMDGPVQLMSPLRVQIKEVLDFLDWLVGQRIMGFNLAHDWFKVAQTWTTYKLLGKRVGYSERAIDHVDELALCELPARDGPCLKPRSALDLMLTARKGPWQSLMSRDPIIVRRVPAAIAPLVRDALEARIKVPEIFFAKRKKKNDPKWKIRERKDPDFVDIELVFNPASGLKALATQELGLDPNQTLVYADIEIDKKWYPKENQFAPFALSVGKPGEWNWAWPDVIHQHDAHWAFNPLARKYGELDVEYPRKLWDKWGRPAFGDNDSLLACKSGAMRWKGFSANIKGIEAFKRKSLKKMDSAPRAPSAVMAYLRQVLAPEEQIVLTDPKTGNLTTKKIVLEEISKMKECVQCNEGVDHAECVARTHRAALRARMCLEARKAKKQVEIYDKLITAQRFHVATNIIGARSSRQSGGTTSEGKPGKKSGSLNPQAINKQKVIRAQFPLAFTRGLTAALGLTPALTEWALLGFPVAPEKLVGGDFDKFEVCIADAYYNDPQLHDDLTGIEPPCERGECKYTENDLQPKCSRCRGKPSEVGSIKIHAVVGTLVYPGRSYWDIRATDGKDRDKLCQFFPDWPEEHWKDLYTRAKSAFFALIYFGNEMTLAERLGIPVVDGKKAYDKIMARYPVMAQKRIEFHERFCPLRQPDGIGSKVYWVEPDEYVTSMVGFKRYFTLENQVVRALYDLADDIPEQWRGFKIKVRRRDREQTIANAVRSALLAAAFGLQSANMRAAGNHVIQSTGATLTKELECIVWDFQPIGIAPWISRPMNVHDELPTAIADVKDPTQTLTHELEHRILMAQKAFIERRRVLIPMLGMKWKSMFNWGGK